MKLTKCIEGKLSVSPYPKSANNRGIEICSRTHSDICGPMETATPGGKRYFITFTDDYSRFPVTYLLAHKSEAVDKLKQYVALTKNKFGKTIKSIRSDNC